MKNILVACNNHPCLKIFTFVKNAGSWYVLQVCKALCGSPLVSDHLWSSLDHSKVLYPILSALACRAPAAVPAVVPLPDPPSRRSVAGAERGRNDIGPEDSMAWLGCFSEKMSGKSSDLKNTTSCSSMQSIMVC